MSEQARWRHPLSVWPVLASLAVMVLLLLGGCGEASALNWQSIGPNAHSIISLAVSPLNPPTLFAGSSDQGLFRSHDNGNSWTAVNANLPQGTSVNSIVMDLTQVGLVYIGTQAGVFLSTSSGDHWQSASQGLPTGADGAVTALLLDPNDLTTLYAGTAHHGIYVSHDGAKTWEARGQGLPTGAAVHALLGVVQGQGARLFAALAGAGVYQSNNNGASWSASNTGLPGGADGLSLLEQPSSPGGIYVGTSEGLYRSANNGASWKAVNAGLGDTPPQVFALALNDQQVGFLYAATSTGVYRSADGGTVWDLVAAGIPTGQPAVALAIVGSATNIGTIYASSGQVYRYPSATAAAGGQIITFVVLGILAVLFIWLFFQQRRLLQRLTPTVPPVPGQSGREIAEPGLARTSVARSTPPADREDQDGGSLNGRSDAGVGDTLQEEQP